MVVGLLEIELFVPGAQSLKDRRAVIKSVKEQLRGRFNITVAELEPNDKWQRATVGIATIGSDRTYVAGLLRQVTDWIRGTRLVELIQVEEEYL